MVSYVFRSAEVMGGGKPITDVERGRIKEMIAAGHSDTFIAAQLDRSIALVRNCRLRGPDNPPGKGCGPKRKLDERDIRRIEHLASEPGASVRSIASQLTPPVSHVTVWKAMESSEHLCYRKMTQKPRLTQVHRDERLAFARTHITWVNQWHSVVFSDEKRFNPDGPDGNTSYWYDLRREPQSYFSRQMGGGSVMIWCAISHLHHSPIVTVRGTLTAEKYTQILSSYLRPLRDVIAQDTGDEIIFQQDNAPVHTAGHTTDWLNRQGIAYMDWPPNSPDLNPIENVFGLLAKAVYAGNRQFSSIAELSHCIDHCWTTLPQAQIANIIDSMHDRMVETLMAQGGSTHY
jgi:transposase